ncbi:YkvA family protein [Cohnella thailandensis]|uniref:DUF1232 domain-containing protein n=1 Tax=Cohnella thailandensis TaxID=557557 RepID=A0A841T5E4_9BACL|nr:YkvA family protein [Cohnella thailandensis]MBB6637087.1 DUF1232 domain-containing protein [Cohnella thailandensis]MBP1973022.1 uncharacterized membrane protein YkvA (DUF1232 family) [Cohnella thailandensis]
MMERLKSWARQLKRKVYVLFYAYKDNRTPWYAKMFAVCVVAYAFSPVDLIPDFIPVLGYLDDLILVPIGVTLALKLIPDAVLQESIVQAEQRIKGGKPKNWFVGSLIVLLWIAAFLWFSILIFRHFWD